MANLSMFGTASILGMRWLRKWPGATLTTSPAFPSLSMDCSTGRRNQDMEVPFPTNQCALCSADISLQSAQRMCHYRGEDDVELAVAESMAREDDGVGGGGEAVAPQLERGGHGDGVPGSRVSARTNGNNSLKG
jgi:hypothetical protein